MASIDLAQGTPKKLEKKKKKTGLEGRMTGLERSESEVPMDPRGRELQAVNKSGDHRDSRQRERPRATKQEWSKM